MNTSDRPAHSPDAGNMVSPPAERQRDEVVRALRKATDQFEEIREGAVVQDSAFWNEATINGTADMAEEAGNEARQALQSIGSGE